MTEAHGASKKEQLRQAIAAQEGLRGTLDDAIVDATIAALQQQLAALESAPEPEQQRKLMTVLFMDVVGSTRLLRGLDPEENLAIMDAVLQRLARPVEARGGRVVRFMGDGFKAVFGLPRARENDPEMAVRGGLELLATAREVAVDLAREHHLEGFQVRVGVNTGLVVTGGVTEGEGTMMGLAVNLAARLESSAPPGGMLISQDTYRHVRGLFEVEPGEAIEVKGFAEPVPVYHVIRARPRAFELTTRGMEGVETPMLGREAELGALREAMHAVGREHRGRFITVVGEAGLGKSRLLREFERWLDLEQTPVERFKGRATLETLDLPYGLLRDLIAHQVGILEDDPAPAVGTKLVEAFGEALGQGRNLERNAHFVGQLLGYDLHDSPHLKGVLDDPRQLRDRALVYLTEYLGALAAGRPLVLFLEDVHWADGSSLDSLLELFDRLSNQQMLAIALTRPSLFERLPAWQELEHHQRLDLQPLSRQESRRLVEEILTKVEDLPDALRDPIIDNAEGNPFYLEELIKMLVEDGVIVKSEPLWRIRADRLGAVRIPPTLTGVIQARIEGLPARERRILQQASVVGRVFWDEAVCFLNKEGSPDEPGKRLGPEETRQELATLQAREMIFEQATSVFSDAAEYLFRHAVLREVTYESVLKRLRRTYHGMVADWLMAHGSDGAGKFTGLIAGHLEKAGRTEEALEQLSRAAEAAVANYARDEATDFYTRALALTPEEDLEKRYGLLRGRMEAFSTQGNRAAQREDLEVLTSLAEVLADDRQRVQVSLDWAWLGFWTSDFPAMMAAAERALRLAQSARLQDLATQAHYALAWAALQLGDHQDALVHGQRALDLARKADDLRSEKNGLRALGLVHVALGNYVAARDHCERVLVLARELGDPRDVGTALNNLGVVSTLLGEYQRAQDLFQQDLEILRDIGDTVSESAALVNLGWVGSARGDWEAARDHALAGLEIKRKTDHKEAVAEGLVWLGHAWLGLGQPAEATAAYQESLDLRRALEQAHLAMGALAGLARVAASQGDLAAAEAYVDEVLAYLAGGGTLSGTWEPLRIYLTCFRVLDQVADPRADRVLAEAFALLQEQAHRIPDEADRRRFLEGIPWHRKLVAAWNDRRTPE